EVLIRAIDGTFVRVSTTAADGFVPRRPRYRPAQSSPVAAPRPQDLCNAPGLHHVPANWRCGFPPPDDYSQWYRPTGLDVACECGVSPPPQGCRGSPWG